MLRSTRALLHASLTLSLAVLPAAQSVIPSPGQGPQISRQGKGGGDPHVGVSQTGIVEPDPITIGNGDASLTMGRSEPLGIFFQSAQSSAHPDPFAFDEIGIWALLLQEPGCTEPVELRPEEATFIFNVSATATQFTAEWLVVQAPVLQPGDTVTVTVTGRLEPGDSVALLDVAVHADTQAHALNRVVFPRMQYRERGDDVDQILALPRGEGLLFFDPTNNPVIVAVSGPLDPDTPKTGEPEAPDPEEDPLPPGKVYVHPGGGPNSFTMQWFAYYDSGESPSPGVLYYGTRDRDGYFKEFITDRASGSGAHGVDSILFRLRQVPEDNLNARDYVSPYPFFVGVLSGDWYTAAREYRDWTTTEGWAARVLPMRLRGGYLDGAGGTASTALAPDLFSVVNLKRCPDSGPPGSTDKKHLVPDQSYFRGPASLGFPGWDVVAEDLRSYYAVPWITAHVQDWEYDALRGDNGQYLHPVTGEVGLPTLDFAAGMNALPLDGWRVLPYVNVDRVSQNLGLAGEVYELIFEAAGVQDECGELVLEELFGAHKDMGCGSAFEPSIVHTSLCHATSKVADYAKSLTQLVVQLGATGIYVDEYTGAHTRLCYDPGATQDHVMPGPPGGLGLPHPVGGGDYYDRAKRELLDELDLLLQAELQGRGVGDGVIYSEGVAESFVGRVDLTYRHATPKSIDYGGGSVIREAPLFATVYGDYLQIGDLEGDVLKPHDDAVTKSPDLLRSARRWYAAHRFMGHVPSAGMVLSDDMLSDYTDADGPYGQGQAGTLYDAYRLYLGLTRNYVDVLKQPTARYYVRFGERLRDPQSTVSRMLTAAPSFGSPEDLVELLLPYGDDQPLVYTTAFGRPDDATAPVGFLLLRWTEESVDDGVLKDANDPDEDLLVDDDEEVSLTFALDDYGLAPGLYDLMEVGVDPATGGELLSTSRAGVALAGPTATIADLRVPARSARFLFLVRVD